MRNQVGSGCEIRTTHPYGMEKRIREELKNAFRPELLNRIDEIIVFHKLTKPELRQIVQLMTKDIKTRLAELNIELKFTSGVIDLIAEEGFDQNTGHVNSSRDSKRKSKTHLVKHSSVEKFASVKK